MDQISGDEIVFIDFCNIYIIECKCLNNLIPVSKPVYNPDFASYYCNKVIIIKIYDYNKNIIVNPINNIKHDILLKKDLIINSNGSKKHEKFMKHIYFKTFLRVFLLNNKINNTKYYVKKNGEIFAFKNDTFFFKCSKDIFKLNYHSEFYEFINTLNLMCFSYKDNKNYYIRHKSFKFNKIYKYIISIYENTINISRSIKCRKESYIQTIICDKKLNILKLSENINEKVIYEENRDNSGKIINIKKYNSKTDKLKIIYCNDYSKSLIEYNKTFYKELLDFYYVNAQRDLQKFTSIKDNEIKKAQRNLLNEINKNIIPF